MWWDLLAVCGTARRTTVHTPTETTASLKASQNSRCIERKSWVFTGLPVERINLTLICHAHCVGSFTLVQRVTPAFHNSLQNIQGSKGPALLKLGFT